MLLEIIGEGSAVQLSSPSVSMQMHSADRPDGWGIGRSSIAVTVPELDAWTVALT